MLYSITVQPFLANSLALKQNKLPEQDDDLIPGQVGSVLAPTMAGNVTQVALWDADGGDSTAWNIDDYYTIDGQILQLEPGWQEQHYDVDMAALLKLGEWFDYLKKEEEQRIAQFASIDKSGNKIELREENTASYLIRCQTP